MQSRGGADISVSVVVPSYRRAQSLADCLAALEGQNDPPTEVIVVTRVDDSASRAMVASSRWKGMQLREVVVSVPGQVAALSAGLKAATGEVVAFTDDDAAPRSNWISGMRRWFGDDEVIGVGGRDVVPDDGPDRDGLPVGIVRWTGKVVGNHHLGTGGAREVDVLKGANMAFRRDRLLRCGFDERLRGSGAQVHNDLKLSLAMRRTGGRLVYDPSVMVDHYPAVRPAGDTRGSRTPALLWDAVHNETLALLEYLPPYGRWVFGAWAVLVGKRPAPGLAHALYALARGRGSSAITDLQATMRGRLEGLRTFREGRRKV